jgi:hypothetical protein
MWDEDLWVQRAPTYKEYYNVLWILSNQTPFFSRKIVFWIPVMKSGSNFTNNCRWPLTGYLTVKNNCHRVEICTSGHDARKQRLSWISRLYIFILFLLHRWKDLKKIRSSSRTSCYIDQSSLKISTMTEGNWFNMLCLISVVYTCMHTSKNVFTQGCSKYMHFM